MTPEKQAIYNQIFSIGETWTDSKDTADNATRLREWIDLFLQYLRPPARVLVPGGMLEALALAEAGFEVHALQIGDESCAWLNKHKSERLVVRQMDIHDLDYPEGFFDGYFSVQVNEHLMPWFVHIGEVRYCSRVGAVAFVDACGIAALNPDMNSVQHVNLVPEQIVKEQWGFWGFRETWRGPLVGSLGETGGDQRPQFVFTKLADDDSNFKHRAPLGEIMRDRRLL